MTFCTPTPVLLTAIINPIVPETVEAMLKDPENATAFKGMADDSENAVHDAAKVFVFSTVTEAKNTSLPI